MKIWRPDIAIVLASLILGSLIYMITRSEAIAINQYMSSATNGNVLATLQNLISNDHIPSWIIYSLPDGLWMLALATSIMMIWQYEINFASIAFTVMASFAGTMFEILQGMGIIAGTFDWSDLIFVSTASILPVSLTFLKSRICKRY